MKFASRLKGLLFTLGLVASAVATAVPANYSFNGTFADDDDVQLFSCSTSPPMAPRQRA